MTNQPNALQTIDLQQLARATGGNAPISTDPNRCTPANPQGERVYNQSAHSYPRPR